MENNKEENNNKNKEGKNNEKQAAIQKKWQTHKKMVDNQNIKIKIKRMLVGSNDKRRRTSVDFRMGNLLIVNNIK